MIDNLNNYIIFHTVAKCGNISRAAKELFISQPAISKSILKLEAELGTTLFHRNSRGVSLTEQGHLLYEYVERALDNLDQGGGECKEILRNRHGTHKDRSEHLSVQICAYRLP